MSQKLFAKLLIGIGLVCLIVVRVELYSSNWNNQTLLQLVQHIPRDTGKKVTVEGIVSADPDARDTTLQANIDVGTLDGVSTSGTLIAFFPTNTELTYGMHVSVKGTLRIPDAFETQTGVFDYPHYLQAQGISAMLTSAKLVSSTPAKLSLFGILFNIKHRFDASLEKIFIAPQGALMEGMLLGERHGIPPDLQQAFIISSLVHIVVLSGHVLTLIADAIMRTLAFLPKRYKYPLGGAMIILFVLMVGASSTAVRAGLMAIIGLVARFSNRKTEALRALLIASGVMVLWNPPIMLWDSSFILSVLAALGLITCSPAIERLFWWVPEAYELRAIATSTLSVEIFIVPALLYFTGTLSFFALPANILALPVLPWAMFAGFLAGALNLIPGVLGLMLAFVPAFFAQLLVRWVLFVATTIADIPHSATIVVAFPLWGMMLFYVPLFIFAAWSWRQQNAHSLHPN